MGGSSMGGVLGLGSSRRHYRKNIIDTNEKENNMWIKVTDFFDNTKMVISVNKIVAILRDNVSNPEDEEQEVEATGIKLMTNDIYYIKESIDKVMTLIEEAGLITENKMTDKNKTKKKTNKKSK